MELLVCQDQSELVRRVDEWCQRKITQYAAQRVFLPSGATPVPLYAEWEKSPPAYLKGLELTQLDEVTSGPKKGSFRAFFEQHLPSFMPQFVRLEDQMEIPDLVILGLGMNGHVAFHEPHVREDLFRGFVNLADDTCERMGSPYRTTGLTFGLKCFKQAKGVLLFVRGADKQKILREFLAGNMELPATHLKSHADITVLVDREAYGE